MPINPSSPYLGYDNLLPSMAAVFIATGPAFLPGRIPEMSNLAIYELLCRTLHLTPAPNNGTEAFQALLPFLKPEYR